MEVGRQIIKSKIVKLVTKLVNVLQGKKNHILRVIFFRRNSFAYLTDTN